MKYDRRWHGRAGPLMFIPILMAILALIAVLEFGVSSPVAAESVTDPGRILPDRILEWKRTGPPIRYGPDTLFEKINGAAEAYLKSGFLVLWTAEYALETEGPIAVEFYRHERPILAFGMYSQERWPEAGYMDTRGLSWLDPDQKAAGLWTGSWYVKISALDPTLALEKFKPFVTAIRTPLKPNVTALKIFNFFPKERRLPFSERFVNRDFLGYPFFRRVFAADYDLAKGRATLFVIEGENEEEIQGILKDYLGNSAIAPGHLGHDDPYQGRVELHWAGVRLLGVVSPEQAPEAIGLLEGLAAALPGN